MLNRFLDKYIFTNMIRFKDNNFHMMNIPFLIFPIDALISLSSVNDAEKQKQFYLAFKDSSKKFFMPRFKEIGIDNKKKMDFLKDFFSASGWGVVQIIDLDFETKKSIIILDDSPFAKQLKGKTKFPSDNILRGIFAGIFSILFEDDIDCVEVECFALNAKSCKFVIKRKSEFDFGNKIVKEQLFVE